MSKFKSDAQRKAVMAKINPSQGRSKVRTSDVYSGYEKRNVKTKTKMTPTEIKGRINTLIYDPPKSMNANSPEVLSIVVLRSKKHYFNFLKGKTRWNVVGDWEGYPNEENVQLDVQFKDTIDDRIGKELIRLFKAYNKEVVGEELLYVRTVPVEETTL